MLPVRSTPRNVSFIFHIIPHSQTKLTHTHTKTGGYVTNLKILQTRYVDPLREASKTSLPILSASDVATLFSSLEAVPKLNERFVEDVGKRVKDWHALQTIGDVFDEYAPFFKTYLVYVQGFEKMSKRLLSLRKENERFRMFLEYLEMKERLPPLQSLLIMPVQRIPRYQLLIRDLIKNTHDTHPDYKLLNKALGKIANTAKHINDSMNRQKRALKLYVLVFIVSCTHTDSLTTTTTTTGTKSKACSFQTRKCLLYLLPIESISRTGLFES